MFVLRKDTQIGVRGDAHADLLEVQAGLALAARPEIDPGDPMAFCHNFVGEIELAVKFECSSLNGECARGRPRLGSLVHDPHSGAELGQPQRQDEAGRAGSGYQDIASLHPGSANQIGRTDFQIQRNKIQAGRNKIKVTHLYF